MSRYINLADDKGRNAEVIFSGITKKPLVKMVTTEGEETHSVRVLKGKAENSYEGLKLKYKDDDAIVNELLSHHPEIDLELT